MKRSATGLAVVFLPSLLALLLFSSLAACGGDSGGGAPTTPPPPPPPNPLSWTDAPESVTVKVFAEERISLSLSSAVEATFTQSADNDNVAVTGESPRAGIYRLTVTGVKPGDANVTVTATAPGYATATATIPITVELRLLEWRELPDEIALEVGEGERVHVLRLNAAVQPEIQIEVSNDNVAATAECGIGSCELAVEGLAEGESLITVTATADGYSEATGEIGVFVTDPFHRALWEELVFDAFDCPSGDSSASCARQWGRREVEDRITSVLPSQPNFHVLTTFRTRFGTFRFTRSDIDTIRDAIRDAVPQTTGERFDGRITTSSTSLRDQSGWVDIIPIGNDLFESGRGPCGLADVGARNGTIFLNVDRLDVCDLLPLAMHEVGHALGFFHVLDLGDYIMSPFLSDIPPVFHDDEQYHARLGWELGRGERYTPDPRQRSRSFAALTTGSLFPEGSKNLDQIAHALARAAAHAGLLQCHPN
ncbi:MAG: hypothetical protein OXI50_16365 [Gammaproteobacteria bacterium]|nr:hypothetical protein [Gammaproteobacteria bacterium]